MIHNLKMAKVTTRKPYIVSMKIKHFSPTLIFRTFFPDLSNTLSNPSAEILAHFCELHTCHRLEMPQNDRERIKESYLMIKNLVNGLN
jgi:hypothetical protein